MYIKAKIDTFDKTLIHIPNNIVWVIYQPMFDDEGNDDYNVYLKFNDEKLLVCDTYLYTDGREKLKHYIVGEAFEEIVNSVAELVAEPNCNFIDLEKIENEIIDKYVKTWADKGYITLDENGSW